MNRPLHTNVRRPLAMAALLGAALVLVLAACGQVASVSLTPDAASAELLRGSEVQVEVTLTRLGGASADVTLDVTGLPANVNKSFSPVTLTGGTLTSTLTLSATAAAVEGDYDLTITGTGPGLTATAPLALDVVSLNVTGRVVSLFDTAVTGAAVGSQGDTAITDADGAFSLTGLSVPYDLNVWNSTAGWLHVYEQFTAAEVKVAPFGALMAPATGMSTTVSGTLSGGVIPVAANQMVMVCVEGVGSVVLGCDQVAPTESSYSLTAEWGGSASREVRVHALQIQRDGAGYPVGYPGYATKDVTLNNGAPATVDLDLGTALATTTIDVTVDSPVAIAGTAGALQVGPNLALAVMAINNADTSHEVVMPVVNGATYTFAAMTGLQEIAWQVDVTGPTTTIVVPTGPTLVSPADAATNISGTSAFTAANPAAGPLSFVWSLTGGPLIGVTTMATSHTIPDPTPFGMAIPASTNGSWTVMGHSGASAESGAGGLTEAYNAIFLLIAGFSTGPDESGTVGMSGTWTFTTAP